MKIHNKEANRFKWGALKLLKDSENLIAALAGDTDDRVAFLKFKQSTEELREILGVKIHGNTGARKVNKA